MLTLTPYGAAKLRITAFPQGSRHMIGCPLTSLAWAMARYIDLHAR